MSINIRGPAGGGLPDEVEGPYQAAMQAVVDQMAQLVQLGGTEAFLARASTLDFMSSQLGVAMQSVCDTTQGKQLPTASLAFIAGSTIAAMIDARRDADPDEVGHKLVEGYLAGLAMLAQGVVKAGPRS